MEYYIYALTTDDLPFYIGKTKNLIRRKQRHISNAKTGSKTCPVYNKIRKILNENRSVEIKLIEALTEYNVDEREIFWISEYKNQGYKLFNATLGGDGGVFSPESIEKIRRIHLGRHVTSETRKKISDARRGMKFSEEHKNNLSIARKKRVISEETKNKTRMTSLGKINIKKYKLIDPNDKVYYTANGLCDFCRQHNLTSTNLMKVLSGERKHHKGWRIYHVD